MRFSCPDCGASYNVKNTHRLAESGGRVECYRCHHVFDVLAAKAQPKTVAGKKPTKLKITAKSGKRDITRREEKRRGPIIGVITGAQPEYDIPGNASRLEAPPVSPDRPPPPPPEATPDQPTTPSPRRRSNALASTMWTLGVLILSAGLAINALWHLRADPRAHGMLQTLCEKVDCEIPPLRKPNAFRITERVFTRIPDHPDVLVMRLRLANTAGFAQPYPGVELLLYDSSQTIVGKGRVVAEDYLDADNPDQLASGALGEIELNMLDPGQLATGFEVAFF